MSHIQSILIDSYKYSLEDAIRWIEDHDFKSSFGRKEGPHITENEYRFRQRIPNVNRYRYRTKQLTDGIQAIIGFPL